MTDWKQMTAFAVLIAGIVVSRIISERAFRRLDDATKLAVMDVFTGMRIWSMLPLVVLLFLMVASRSLLGGHAFAVLSGFFACLVAYLTFVHHLIGRKMRRANVPDDYLRTFMRARWISYLTVVLMIALLIGGRIIDALRT